MSQLQTISFNNKRPRTHSPDRMGMDENEPSPRMPTAIVKLVKHHARINAAKSCQIQNLADKITAFDQDLIDGTIPKHLDYKFRKLYIKPEEVAIRTTIIRSAIQQEIVIHKQKKQQLATEYDARLTNLTAELSPTMLACNLQIPNEELIYELETLIQSFRVSFLLKQQSDAKRKEEKRLKFLAYKEVQDTSATVTNKDVSGFKASIKQLQKQIKQLSLTTRQGKGKGAASKSPRNTPTKNKKKSTGTGKGKGGKPKSTAKNKKSRGKNGKQ